MLEGKTEATTAEWN